MAIGYPVTEKLTRHNFSLWKAQVMPAIRGAQLEGFIDGTTPAPPKQIEVTIDGKKATTANEAYAKWIASDQQVLSYLLSTLSKEILTQVATKQSAADVWTGIEEMLASQTRTRSVTTRIALTTTQKGSMFMSDYFGKMRSLADDMAASGKPLDDEELVGHILAGLDADYNPVVSAILSSHLGARGVQPAVLL